jgi:hypothetical protein
MIKIYDIAQNNSFSTLTNGIVFEKTIPGRKVAILANELSPLPLVRTTTKYDNFPQLFTPEIKSLIGALPAGFRVNNIMAEIYSDQSNKMRFHSDQALDLESGSLIGIFSCYSSANVGIRNLIIRDKTTLAQTDCIEMTEGSFIVFSLKFNKLYQHKIILDAGRRNGAGEWLGLTMRLSKTLITFINESAYFANGEPLTLATAEQKKEFMRLKARENKEADFDYSGISITYSL